MRVLIGGGVFRLSQRELVLRQPSPEVVLAGGLRRAGVEVETCALEDLRTIANSRQFDVVHVHHWSKAAVVAAISPLAAPMVFTAHSTKYGGGLDRRLSEALVSRRMKAVVCLSHAEAQQVRTRFPVAAHKVTVIPNGVRLPDAAPVERKLDGVVRALFVGQLIPIKQVDRAIRSLERLSNIELRLVFHGEMLRHDLERLANDLGVARRVFFVGQRHGEELFEEYQQAHMLWLPSSSEALPTVITEALSTGLPIVASDVGGIREQVRSAGVLVPPNGADSFRSGVDQLLSDYESVMTAAVRRAAQVRDEYAVDSMISKHIKLYESLRARAKD